MKCCNHIHIYFHQDALAHIHNFLLPATLKNWERKSVDLDLTYSSAHHQHNETVDDGTTPEQANLSVVLPTNENSL